MTADDRLSELRIDRRDEAAALGGRRWRRWAVSLVVAAVAAAALWAWSTRPRAAEVTLAVVRESAAPSGAGAVLNASGYVTARRQATVSSKITGRVTEVRVEEGMRVAEGQVLARLDDALARDNLRLATAQLAAARSALAETRVRIDEARLELERQESLESSGVASRSQLDTARAAYDALVAHLAAQREDVRVAGRQEKVRRQELSDTVIRAPFSGVAISKDAQPGEIVSPVSAGGGFTRTGITTLVDMSSLEIEVDVNESYIQRVEPGQEVEAVLDSYPDWRIPAHVITLIPTADRQKATVKVRVGFDRLDPRILPDMGVKVAFLAPSEAVGGGGPSLLLVPRGAVRRGGETPVVFVVRDGRAERRAVRLGGEEGDDVQVLSGLAAGERVVVEGPADLAAGRRVRERAPAGG